MGWSDYAKLNFASHALISYIVLVLFASKTNLKGIEIKLKHLRQGFKQEVHTLVILIINNSENAWDLAQTTCANIV